MTNQENTVGADPTDWMQDSEVEEYKNMQADAVTSESNGAGENTKEHEADIVIYELGEQFDIRNIEELQNKIKDTDMNAVKGVQFNVSDIKKIDAAAIQFLAAFMKYANQNLIPSTLINMNDYMKKSIQILGFEKILING